MHINELFSLKGSCAVVIGGGGKIGFPMSEALAEAGATVYIASKNIQTYEKACAKLTAQGLDVKGIQLDQADESSVMNALQKIRSEYKIPDILINCGVERPMKKFFEDTLENWNRSMLVNATGLFSACRVFGNAMADSQEGGTIINVASIYGSVAPDMSIYIGTDFQTEPDYPYTKGGMIMFSKYLASYYSKKNVRVNVISPGGFYNNQSEPFLSNYIRKVPMGRMANHDDLKGVTVFLASKASQYITGENILVDGGFNII
jgi:NAD(P)-dependent dehydrogenase (short-subunit alcohol dehydrogenase family)